MSPDWTYPISNITVMTECILLRKQWYWQWLNTNAGKQYSNWTWSGTGKMKEIEGVYIKDPSVATMFKLKFSK